MPTKPQKFLFDTDFGMPRITVIETTLAETDETEEPTVVEAPPPPTFSEEELGLAREQAFEAGRQAGLHEAATALDQMVGMALATAAHHLHALSEAQTAANAAIAQDAVAVALAVLRKLHPELCRRFGLDEITAAITDSLAHLSVVPRITIKTHPDLIDKIREKSEIIAAQSSFDGKLVVSADPHMSLGDCRLDWGDGGVERDTTRSWTEIDRAVETALGKLSSLTEAM
jgi:flagellar assembly protein FliH